MYEELNVHGVYFAPFVAMLLTAWLLTQPLNAISNRYALSSYVWHHVLFNFCIYIVVLAFVVYVWRLI